MLLFAPLFSFAQTKAFDRARWPDINVADRFYACKCSRVAKRTSHLNCDCISDDTVIKNREQALRDEIDNALVKMRPYKPTPYTPLTWDNPNEQQKAWMDKAKSIKLIRKNQEQ